MKVSRNHVIGFIPGFLLGNVILLLFWLIGGVSPFDLLRGLELIKG